MISGGFGASRGDVLRIFDGDSVAGLNDGDLLVRFARRRDEAAFEALVARLGPMVLGTCRRMLPDPHDVDDAFQATFLVLVKKARSVRNPDLVAPWLHGVATRVARRARSQSARRSARERVGAGPEALDGGSAPGLESEWPELRALIDEEIERLPEDHRRAVVLCDVEGLSREEAAARLGWSLNMVRGRLERARERLRGRLARRGLAPSGAWAALVVAPPSPPPALLASTTRAALSFSAGRLGSGLATASAVALSEGVLRMMMLSKIKLGLAALASTGLIATGSGMLAAQGTGEKPAAKAAPAVGPPAAAKDELAERVGELNLMILGKSRIDMARKRWETQLAFYNEGRITIDRLLNATQTLMDAELDATEAPKSRLDVIKAHLDRIKDVEKRELAELEVGRATAADVEEVQSFRLDVEFRLAKEAEAARRKGAATPPPAAPKADAARDRDQERLKIARRIYDDAQRLFSSGEVGIDGVLAASKTLLDTELGAGRTGAARVAAIRAHIKDLRKFVAAEEDLFKKGQVTRVDLDRARLRLLDAEGQLLDDSEGTDGAAEGSAPKPSEASPTPDPGTPGSPRASNRSPLGEAVEAFNARWSGDPVGRDQPPLTEDEVIAAVRFRERAEDPAATDWLFAEFRKIAETRRMPPGSTFEVIKSMDPGGDFAFEGWWVRIAMPSANGGTYSFPIRTRVARSKTLEEVINGLEAESTPKLDGGRRLDYFKMLKARIDRRDRDAASKKADAASKE